MTPLDEVTNDKKDVHHDPLRGASSTNAYYDSHKVNSM